MGNIKLSEIRIAGFRGLSNIQLSLEENTILTGCNNVGKTSVLKALQLALGNSSFLTHDDFNLSYGTRAPEIIIDLKFIPVDNNGKSTEVFDELWEEVFTTFTQFDNDGKQYFAFRTKFKYSSDKSDFGKEVSVLKIWTPASNQDWRGLQTTKGNFDRDAIPFYYIEAQRDIVEDSKIKTSFMGKMISNVEKSYPPESVKEIEGKIQELNETTVQESEILNNIQKTLEEIETTIDTKDSSIKITPFTKKIRDLNKGLSIQYGTEENSFTMDYHGMGTRSWSSLLTFKAFILQNKKMADENKKPFHPIVTIEEPEAHLHPSAQKRLYSQISSIPGQKIVSTHSPYIAACAKLEELRSLYKNNDELKTGKLDLSVLDDENIRKLKQWVINSKGEIIFSKAIILFEGETEEQALPIFAEHILKENPVELGFNFISVNGYGNYYPFIVLAEEFNIPWYIFSDGEKKTKKKVLKSINQATGKDYKELTEFDNVFVIENGGAFEQMLLKEGYMNEISLAFDELFGENSVANFIKENQDKFDGRQKTDKKCDFCHQYIYVDTKKDYTTENGTKKALSEMMSKNKAQYAPKLAEIICNSNKGIPLLIQKLFDKIKEDLFND